MPRTSKKTIKRNAARYIGHTDGQPRADETTEQFNVRVYRTALYVRLSVEDIRKKNNDSIGTQKALLEGFIKTRPDLRLCKIYEDLNYTGTNFKRPGFTKMLDDVEAGLIDCIVVKDLSRLGRNFQETAHYLERVFPARPIRFISVSDDYDTLTATVDESGLLVPLKTLMNEIYARDVSVKVKSSYRVKQRRGEFCGSFAPYGYIKTGATLVIDAEAAPVVKKIFEWRAEGLGFNAIARRLNALRVAPPGRYRFKKGVTKRYEQALLWHKSAVKRVLRNPVYTGDMTQARYKSVFLKGGVIEADRDEWITVEHTHPAIIDGALFAAAREME